jgi:hypothetical protein
MTDTGVLDATPAVYTWAVLARPVATIDSGLESVNQLVAPSGTALLFARGPESVVTIEGIDGIVLADRTRA